MWQRRLAAPWVKPTLLVLCALPAMWLWWAGFTDRLGANPAEALIRGLGDWTLRLLCLTFLITPLRQTFGLAALAAWRRGLGVWTFAYASQHALAYAWLDMGLGLDEVASDVAQRPFIALGFVAWLCLLPLAATSFNRAMRWLGAARWRRLHQAVYAVAGLAIAHFYWMRAGKNHFTEVYVYAGLLALLLGWRVGRWARAPRSAGGGPVGLRPRD